MQVQNHSSFFRSKTRSWSLGSILFLAAAFTAQAQNNPNRIIGDRNKTIITAVPFLTITPDARAAALGESGVSTSADVNSTFWNPAKTAFNTKDLGLGVSYTPWLRSLGINDINLSNLSGYYKLRKEDAIAVSFTYFSLGMIGFTDVAGNRVRDFNPNELSLAGSYSRQLFEDRFSVGLTARYIHSNLVGSFSNTTGVQGQPANSLSVDLGGYWTDEISVGGNPSQLSFGLALTNFGPKVSYSDNNRRDFIPTTLRLGGTLTTEIDQYNKFSFTLEASKLAVPTPEADGRVTDSTLMGGFFTSFYKAPGGSQEKLQEIMISAGVEYWYDNLLAVRGGYFHESPEKGNRRYFTAGMGVRYQKFGLDLAYLIPVQTNHPLAETLRFTLLFDFDLPKKGEESVKDKSNTVD